MMKKLLSTITAPVIASAIASALIAPAITAVMNYHANETISREAKIRETRLTEILKFQSSGDPMLAALSAFVVAVGKQSDTKKAAYDLHSEILKQINASNELKVVFDNSNAKFRILRYQEALATFAKSIDDPKDVADSADWQKAFSNVYTRRDELQNALATDAGLNAS